MFCGSCGSEQAQDAKFCSNCGQALQAGAAPTTPVGQELPEFVQPRIRTGVPDFVKKTLYASEVILGSFSGSLFDHHRRGEFRHDKFVLTSERIICYHTALIHKGMAEMPYRTLTSVEYDKGWFHGKVVVEAANAGLTIAGIGNDDAAFTEKIIAGSIAGRRFAAAS